ncbi:hypothetical protein N7457_009706 [Penicillium paradoxum]|uniref:uncharacterized protein n=1 Tax=Penicillium paradoxum TaxID=176176 RepID=UPI002546AB3E|nr:uncharacterized protein N7457_009706 [Penicillium paradoxum]KAJ5774810.1 hypothetical protein N7457_009706 [Penicillium paradoxum]
MTSPDSSIREILRIWTFCSDELARIDSEGDSGHHMPRATPEPDINCHEDVSSYRAGEVFDANQSGLPDEAVKEGSDYDLTSHTIISHHHHHRDLSEARISLISIHSLCTHIYKSFTFQTDSDASNIESSLDGQEDPEIENESVFEDSIADDDMKMMFVSGETAEPSPETTTLIEEITRQQVIEILTRSTALATRRGVRSISTDDLIFLIRHDKAKVSRLRTFLSWKDVRKNVKDSDDKGGGDAADFAAADDAAGVVAGPQDVAAKPKNKRAKVGLAWDVNSFYSIQVPEREDEEDEEEEEQNYATLQRLAAADERTRHMTKEEYVFWSECRQASFTYRKSKRFREWAGFGIVTESKPNDDIVDILGFLTFEIVQTLTEEALKVKEREDNEKNRRGGAEAGENLKKRKRETGLFDPPEEGRTPIEPRHVREAYRKLQATPQKAVAMLLHEGRVPARLPLVLI